MLSNERLMLIPFKISNRSIVSQLCHIRRGQIRLCSLNLVLWSGLDLHIERQTRGHLRHHAEDGDVPRLGKVCIS